MACVYQAAFGVPCPGCGLTRAFRAAAKGDLRAAGHYHPLWWTVPLAAGAALLNERGAVSWPALRAGLGAMSGAFLGVYALRLAGRLPGTAPLRD
jgi:hypothetical protein